MNQAEGLDRIMQTLKNNIVAPLAAQPRRRPRVIAVTGGKGGVGKSCVAVNLGLSLAMAGHDTLLLDADLGLANVDVLLGLSPKCNIANLLAGECDLDDLVLTAARGLKVVPATSGKQRMAAMSRSEYAAVIRAFDDYPRPPEFLIVDTAAGISESVSMFSVAADDVLLVVCDEPASLTDAYALVKVLAHEYGVRRFKVVANMVHNAGHGRQLFEKLERVTSRFLDVNLQLCGAIPQDEYLRRAVRRQTGVADAWPGSPSGLAFKKLAMAADNWEKSPEAYGRIGFFAERRMSRGEQAA
ncbi:MAG TPA: P-loop NTPase [Rhodanobacteraceae bacterium]|nr:P-loop NTPase [Rhodanobacteraceae bacterium]